MLHLLADESRSSQEREALGLAARRFVEEHYGWQQIVPQLEAVYRCRHKASEWGLVIRDRRLGIWGFDGTCSNP